jgi:hypothetical protein
MMNSSVAGQSTFSMQRIFASASSVLAMLVTVTILGAASQARAISLTGWTTVGNSGVSGADGVVPLSPFGDTQYGWVSTVNGVSGVGLDGVGGTGSPTTGSVATSPTFNASAGNSLEFYFNYVTSDGAGFSDYGWAELLDGAANRVALLFTARTTPGGNTVPGFGMPALTATLVPPNTPIQAGTTWSPLDENSGSCFNAGCGNTGWIKASYTIANAGSYSLRYGVVNWSDTEFQSGLAFDGATIAGKPIDQTNDIPTPALLPGLIGIGASMWRKRNQDEKMA